MNAPSMEWKQVHEIRGDDGVVVRIQRRGDTRPLYSYQIGCERRDSDDDRLLPFVRTRIDGHEVNRSSVGMIEAALDWIEGDAATFAANYHDRHDSVRNGEMPRKKGRR